MLTGENVCCMRVIGFIHRPFNWRLKILEMRSYENLNCWQQARGLAVDIYNASADGNLNKDSWLRDRLREAAVSIVSLIAEGRERRGAEAFVHFLAQAQGSAAVLRAQLIIARDVGYLGEADFLAFEDRINRVAAMIGSLIKSVSARAHE